MSIKNNPKTISAELAPISQQIFIILAFCLPVLIPFDSSRNVDLQGLILLVIGLFAWAFVGLRGMPKLTLLDRLLLGIFIGCCLISTAVSPHIGYDLLGAPYIRLGALGLISCIGFGLAAIRVRPLRLIGSLYGLIVAVATASLPYYFIKYHSLIRIGGVFAQADIFAVVLGVGLLLGLYLLELNVRRGWILYITQFFLLGLLILTETRVALILTVLLMLAWQFRYHYARFRRRLLLYIALLLLVIAGFYALPSNRFTNFAYASTSIQYRLNLQAAGLSASKHKVLFGYGPGNLADALNCSKLAAQDLQKTCRQGYFFNSSHNIYIDRILGIGWLGGLAFLLIVIRSISAGLKIKSEDQILSYVLILIALYYLTNVTSIPLELMLWVLLARLLHSSANKA
jgi:O-antigen ligase